MPSAKDEKRKAEDGINGHDSKRLKPSVSPPPSSPHENEIPTVNHAAFPEKPAVAEERNGDISFQVVNNDGKPHSFIVLTGLKCIFQKQLPKNKDRYYNDNNTREAPPPSAPPPSAPAYTNPVTNINEIQDKNRGVPLPPTPSPSSTTTSSPSFSFRDPTFPALSRDELEEARLLQLRADHQRQKKYTTTSSPLPDSAATPSSGPTRGTTAQHYDEDKEKEKEATAQQLERLRTATIDPRNPDSLFSRIIDAGNPQSLMARVGRLEEEEEGKEKKKKEEFRL